uniref:Copia protein n=2 Tax=Anthurium amnicola TaxID=1678845 RepID=A0A1D1XLN0_9ARAE
MCQSQSPKVFAGERVGTGHNGRIVGSSSAFDPPADRQVMSWLLNSMQHSLNQSLLFLNDAKEMWNKIENVSKSNCAARVFQLREELRLCNQGEMSFSEYYASLCKLWEELMFCRPPSSCCPRGALEQRKQAEEDRIFDLLSGLNPQYSNIREQILSQATLPPLHDVYSMLNEGCPEKQQEFSMHPSLIDSEWFSLDSESQSQIQGCCACECAFGGDGCVSGGSKQQEKCARCGQFGHLKDSCWHLFGQSTHCLSTIAKSRIADNSDCTPDSCVSTRTAESPHFESEIQINDIECML